MTPIDAGLEDRLITPAFMSIILAALFYFIGFNVVIPVLPPFVLHSLHGNNLAVGLVQGFPAITAVIARPTAGMLGNRYGRRVLMIVGATLAAASIACYGLAHDIVALAALRLVTGIGQGAFFTGGATLATDLAPPARRGQAISYFSVAVFSGTGLGPLIGQNLSGAIGRTSTFFVAGSVIGLGALLSTRVPTMRAVGLGAVRLRQMINKKALGPGTVQMFGNLGFSAFQAYTPLYVLRLHMGGSQYIFLMYAIINLLFRGFGAKIPDRYGAVRSGTLAQSEIAIGLGVIAIWASPVGLYLGVVIFAFGIALQYPALFTLAVNRATEQERAAVVGTYTAFFDLSSGLGGLLLGLAASAGGYRASYGVGAISALVGLSLLRFSLAPAVARERAAEAAAIVAAGATGTPSAP